jgi:serine/threonine protein phosphatase 1
MNSRLFAIGDIHGCFDQLRTLIQKKIRASKEDKIILVGDYVDRGSKVKEVIDYLIELKNNNFDIIPLIGNHETMLLDALDDSHQLFRWIYNGGTETLRSFGIDSLKKLDKQYVTFFRNLIYYFTYENYIFVHAGFDEKAADPFSDKHSMVWIRTETYTDPRFTGKTIVHGHSPVSVWECRENVANGSNVINIDTGCVYSHFEGYGKLTAIELNSRKLFFA